MIVVVYNSGFNCLLEKKFIQHQSNSSAIIYFTNQMDVKQRATTVRLQVNTESNEQPKRGSRRPSTAEVSSWTISVLVIWGPARCSVTFLSVWNNLRKHNAWPSIWLLISYCSHLVQEGFQWITHDQQIEKDLARKTVLSSCIGNTSWFQSIIPG